MSDVVNAELLREKIAHIINDATAVDQGDFKNGWSNSLAKADAILALPGLQAEAQAPTTAALTDDEREARISIVLGLFEDMHNAAAESGTAYKVDKFAETVVDRLTVGAPAPAPTREQITQAILTHTRVGSVSTGDGGHEHIVAGAFHAADAILALPGLQAEAPEDAEVAEIEKRDAEPIPLSLSHSEFTRRASQAEIDRHTLLTKLRARTSQAEAQAPAVTRDRLLDMRHNSDHAFHEAATSSWDDFAIRFPDALQIACIHRRELIAALLPTTSSQAEAQAPTTAALTDADEMFIRCYLYDSVATFNTYADLHRARGTPEADEKARRNDDMAKRGYEAFRKHMARLTSTVGAPAPAPTMTKDRLADVWPKNADGFPKRIESMDDALELVLAAKGDTP